MNRLIVLGLLVSIWGINNSFAQPVITSFTPGSGTKDTVVRIFGQNFNNITSVSVGGVSYPFSLVFSPLAEAFDPAGRPIAVKPKAFAIDVTIGKFANTGPIIVSGSNGSVSTSGTALGHLGNGSFEALCKPSVNINKSLAINDPSVINHADAINNGPWSFNFLLSQMAPASMSPSTFIKKWILNWRNTVSLRNINNTAVNVTANQGALSNLLGTWPRTAGSSEFDGTPPLDLTFNKFKLVAILFRPDLADSAVPPLFAGEGRFVFKVDNSSDEVILEYKLPINSGTLPTSADQWALKIHDLSTLPFSTSYISALKAVTDRFTKKTFPLNNLTINGSGINQVRTNTIGLESGGWGLREFRLTAQAVVESPSTVAAAAGELVSKATHNSPSEQYNSAGTSGAPVTNWVSQNTAALLNNSATMNPALEGTLSISQTGVWQFPAGGSVTPSVAKAFDMMTCRGCHSPSVNLSFNAGSSNPFLQVSSGGYASFMTGTSTGSVANPQVSTLTPMPGLFGAPFTYNANGSVTSNVGYSDLHNRAHVLLNNVVSGYCR